MPSKTVAPPGNPAAPERVALSLAPQQQNIGQNPLACVLRRAVDVRERANRMHGPRRRLLGSVHLVEPKAMKKQHRKKKMQADVVTPNKALSRDGAFVVKARLAAKYRPPRQG